MQLELPTQALPNRALSLTQPWAYAVVHLGKDIENRRPGFSHKSFRGEFWVHAAASVSRLDFLHAKSCIAQLSGNDVAARIPDQRSIELGGIVGRGRIVDIIPPGDSGRLWHFPEQWGFVLADVRPVPFVPCRGALGFWRVPPDVLAKLAEADRHA